MTTPFSVLVDMIIKCPRCGKETETQGNQYRPFCSERCQLIDLGNWSSGAYRISVNNPDEDEDGAPSPENAEKE